MLLRRAGLTASAGLSCILYEILEKLRYRVSVFWLDFAWPHSHLVHACAVSCDLQLGRGKHEP